MRRWERRLADLATILRQCSSAYFQPDEFRRNCNQFLTTSRTVTFLIQKEKSNIPDFDAWYAANIVTEWSVDPMMRWSKDSRNHIEKEGDLDLHSELAVTLIYSYDEEDDVAIECGVSELVGASVRHLTRLAEKRLPTGVADAAVLRIRRRWVAASLPDRELLQALVYVYARNRVAVDCLARHLGHELPAAIPDVSNLPEFRAQQEEQTTYLKLSGRVSVKVRTLPVQIDLGFQPPEWLQRMADEGPKPNLAGLSAQLQFHKVMAERTFLEFGNHKPMVWLYNAHGEVLFFGGFNPQDQADKFVFWRDMADRIAYLRPYSLIWISELWVRDPRVGINRPVSKMPIVGEGLGLVGIDRTGRIESVDWTIHRDSATNEPKLVLNQTRARSKYETPGFLIPVRRAFERISEGAPN